MDLLLVYLNVKPNRNWNDQKDFQTFKHNNYGQLYKQLDK